MDGSISAESATVFGNAGDLSVGLIYLRPGHIQAAYTLESLRAIEATVGVVEPGFVIIAEHRTGQVRVQLRVPSPTSTS